MFEINSFLVVGNCYDSQIFQQMGIESEIFPADYYAKNSNQNITKASEKTEIVNNKSRRK